MGYRPTGNPPGRPKGVDPLMSPMNAAAAALLDRVKQSEDIAEAVTVFREVARWVAIKHKIADPDNGEGEMLDEYRNRLRNTPPGGAAARYPPSAIGRGDGARGAIAARTGQPIVDGNGGADLDALKARLHADDTVP